MPAVTVRNSDWLSRTNRRFKSRNVLLQPLACRIIVVNSIEVPDAVRDRSHPRKQDRHEGGNNAQQEGRRHCVGDHGRELVGVERHLSGIFEPELPGDGCGPGPSLHPRSPASIRSCGPPLATFNCLANRIDALASILERHAGPIEPRCFAHGGRQ